MEVPQAIKKVLVFKGERAQMLSVNPDAVTQLVIVWEEKGLSRDSYNQDKQGIEKPAWKQPDFIKRIGIMKMGQTLRERDDQKTTKAKMWKRVRQVEKETHRLSKTWE
ncbi:hypothetical protein TNCT_390591 [Trichonephila clavata]|uniref:DUF382 domain-containing protein n=1 Tax=Trichonephila clavata TaxID=2740835 RepID=A0A8X6FY17_TRICU|nr:hypothetical protein TNCT_390591 [Trichonephila clavata]